MKAETTFSLKDQLFNPDRVAYLTDLILSAYPSFSGDAFQEDVVSKFPELELKQRVEHISTMLHKYLPDAYPEALQILVDALPPKLDPTLKDNDFGQFILGPLSTFVATYGCTEEHLQKSLDALKEMTQRFSVEFAIRFFINAFPEVTLEHLQSWSEDDNYHVRRLTSEGTRPKLPWAPKININYTQPLSILDNLYYDDTRFVTRSVANHLNDISKVDPDLVVETLKRWQKSNKQEAKEMAYITRHALRTLIKQGNRAALEVLGYGDKPDLEITAFESHTPSVVVGDAFEFTLTLKSNKKQNLLIDYLMHFAAPEGSKKAGKKVFKLKMLTLEEGKTFTIRKKHPMRLMTTRRLYEGQHQIFLQINGYEMGKLTFDLSA